MCSFNSGNGSWVAAMRSKAPDMSPSSRYEGVAPLKAMRDARVERRAQEIMDSDLFAQAVADLQASAATTSRKRGLFSDEWKI